MLIREGKLLQTRKAFIMKHKYEVNHEQQEIVVTKAFLRKAGVIGSEAYKILTQARADYPGYEVVQREIAKSTKSRAYGKLTYENMQERIEAEEDEDTKSKLLEEFEHVKALSKAQKAPYLFVKKWFLKKYADDFDTEKDVA